MNPQLTKVLSHPLRVEILDRLARTRGAMSPKELSDALDEGLNKVSYHVRVLRDADFIRPVSTKKKRGAVESFYEMAPIAFALALTQTKIPRSNCIKAVLDPQGRKEVSKAMDQTLEKVQAAHDKSAKRLAKSGDQGLDATIVVAGLE